MITINGLTKNYGEVLAVNQASFTVSPGTITGFLGPNGAGKSTVIRHLTGIYQPDSGTVTVAGQLIADDPNLKERIGYISDDVFYFPAATMEDMHRFYRDVYSRFDEPLYQKLKEVFPLPTGSIRRFSKGMQKQAAFHLTLSARPDVLILDEPVDGLDPVMRRQVWQVLLDDVSARGTTVLLSSHNLRELEDVCDHVGIMDKGKVLLERTLSDLQDNTVKIQVAYKTAEEPTLPAELQVLHHSRVGRVHTYIMRGSSEEICRRMQITDPVLLEAIPLTLEEIFIYELGGADDAAHKILL